MDQKSYQALKKLAFRQRLKYIIITLAIWVVTLALFLIYHFKTGAAFTDPSGIAWVLLLLVPFAFKLHRRIFEKEWVGEIRTIKIPKDAERSQYIGKSYSLSFLIKNKGYDMSVVTASSTTIGQREIVLVGDEAGLADSYYRIGDKIVKFAGLKYPINYTNARNEIFCPICGNFNTKDSDHCYVCKSQLIDPERKPEERKINLRDI